MPGSIAGDLRGARPLSPGNSGRQFGRQPVSGYLVRAEVRNLQMRAESDVEGQAVGIRIFRRREQTQADILLRQALAGRRSTK